MPYDLLLAHATKKSREFLYSHPEYRPTFWERWRLKYFLFLHKKGYSVAAITHHKEFYGLDFFVNKHVLIPRPETELMVEEAMSALTTDYRLQTTSMTVDRSPSSVVLIDVGTGSGCIPISIIKTLKYENIKAFATDISRPALRVAKKNAKIHGVAINFLPGNLLEPLIHNSKFIIHNSAVVITANLPYLTEKQFQDEPSIQREPKNALVAKNNGLALYEELLKQIIKFKIYNLKFIILFEIDPSQSPAIVKLIKKYLPQTKISASPDIFFAHSGKKKEFSFRSFDLKIEIKKDLAGRDRLVIIKISTL